MKALKVMVSGALLLVSSSAFAGSVIVTNNSTQKAEVCRGGGYAGCWVVLPGQTKGPDYVQTDRDFWLNRPAQSRHYSVTDDNERYVIEEDFDGNLTMRFLP